MLALRLHQLPRATESLSCRTKRALESHKGQRQPPMEDKIKRLLIKYNVLTLLRLKTEFIV